MAEKIEALSKEPRGRGIAGDGHIFFVYSKDDGVFLKSWLRARREALFKEGLAL